MKLLSFIALMILYFGISLLNYNLTQPENSIDIDTNYSYGILKSEMGKVDNIADYSFFVDFIPSENLIKVKENLIWRNKTNYQTDEIYLHLYANAYKSNNTIFARYYKLSEANRTALQINNITVNGKTAELQFVVKNKEFPQDSTVAKLQLEKPLMENDSVKIQINYELKVPVSVKRFGKAKGSGFYFISQWFPKAGVFENGKWICEPYYPYLNFYADFGKYEAVITAPKNFKVAATGILEKVTFTDTANVFKFVQNGVHDFAWVASDNLLYRKKQYERKDGTKITLNFYLQPNRLKYFERYASAVENSLSFFEENIGIYPYQTLSLIDVPKTSASGGMEYPTLFTVSAELISPVETHQPEKLVAHEFSHQYFQGVLANNEVYEAWLDEGFASYTASKIMEKFYGKGLLHFKLAGYFPVYGINFLSYNDIPVIYSIEKIPYHEYDRSLESYYKNLTLGSIADTSYKLPNRRSYVVNAYSKPELMLHTLERILGEEKFFGILQKYYSTYKFKHPQGSDFINVIKNNADVNLDWFFENVYKKSSVFNYKVRSLKKLKGKEYQLFVERTGEGIFPVDIFIYSKSDTLHKFWDGKSRWKIFRFTSDEKITGAELDPFRKNLFDLNFADNSILTEPSYSASLALSANWFFWLQNALMIFGSI